MSMQYQIIGYGEEYDKEWVMHGDFTSNIIIIVYSMLLMFYFDVLSVCRYSAGCVYPFYY